MGGIEARDGFWFQDARILVRLLRDAVTRRACLLEGAAVPDPVRVKIEASTETAVLQGQLPRPLWDSVTYEGERIVVDESKLGEVTRPERLALYRRIRATCASRGSAANIVPRLTTATGVQPNPGKWRDLARASQEVIPPAAAPAPVGDAETMAAEAMYFMTSESLPDDKGMLVRSPIPPMNIDDARGVLQSFQFDDELDLAATEVELRRLLAVLGAALSIEEVVQHLRGWIATKACARPGGAELTCESIQAELRLLARYLAVPGEAERLWTRLQASTPPLIETRVPLRQLQDAQPAAATTFDNEAIQSVVLVGEGGIGKSFILAQRFAMAQGWKVWVDSAAGAEHLEESLALGVWAATQRGVRLTIFVDGLDQAADSAGVLAAIDRAIAGSQARAVVAARPTTWAAILRSASRWHEVRLERWSLDWVVAATKNIKAIPPDLLDLLRTPLLLDLYLRTIGDEHDAATLHPTSRHELVAEYFRRRVLPVSAPASSERLAFITQLGHNVARGRARWTITQASERAIALDLVGEGLLVDSFGRFRFRHALLQDVCVALALSSTDANESADNLQAVASPSLRHDVMRALMEAAIARGSACELMETPPIHVLVRELLARGLPAADSVGDVVVSPNDASALLGAGLRLRAVLRWARAAENRSWLTAMARLPVTPRPVWLLHGTLAEDLWEIARDIDASGVTEETSRALAVRLRSWAQQDLQPQGWALPTIVAAILRFAPTKETLEWLSLLPVLPPADHCELLRHLRQIASLDSSIDDGMLSDLILRCFESIGRVGGPPPQRSDHDQATNEVVMDCLQPGEKTPSLFDTKPRAAYRVLFELVARHGEAREREQEERERDPAYQEMLAEIGRAFAAELAQAPEEAMESPEPNAADPTAEDGVVEDVPPIGWSPDIYPLHAAWEMGTERLSNPAVATIVKEEALRSRSRAARNLVDGRDAEIRRRSSGAWLQGDVAWKDEGTSANVSPVVGRAWRLLELIVLARGKGISSSFVERGTLAAVLADTASLDLMPLSILRWVPYVLNHCRNVASPRELELWSDTLLTWVEQGSFDDERVIEVFEAIDECLTAIRPRNDPLIDRFAAAFVARFARTSPGKEGKLIGSAYRLLGAHKDTCELMLQFARTHPEGVIVSQAIHALLSAPPATLLAIAEELFAHGEKILPQDPLVEIARYLGVLCCDPSVCAQAWTTIRSWLRNKPLSGTFKDPKSWRLFLDALGNGAAHHATKNIERYAEVASELWAAWHVASEAEVHGLIWILFWCLRNPDAQSTHALASALAPLACEILARGNGFDLAGLDDVPWKLLPAQQLDEVVDALVQRIANGPPEPDEYSRFSASIDDLVKALAICTTLTKEQAERLYAAVQPASWLLHREERCNELLVRLRIDGES